MSATRPTIVDVARALGVATSTVSRAFTRPELLRPETVGRVRAEADRIGYVPNDLARALSTGRPGAVGLVVPDIANPFFPPLVRQAQRTLDEHGLVVVVADTAEDAGRELQMVTRLEHRVEGLVLASSRIADEELRAVARRQHIVLINRDLDGVARVLISTRAAMAAGVRHLVARGRRRLAYVGGPPSSWSHGERRSVLREQTSAAGVTLLEIDPPDSTFGSGQHSVADVLRHGCDAVVAFDDVLAHGVVTGLLAAGIGVPDDVAVLGCDDILAITTHPPLSSVALPLAEAATAAVHALRDVRDGRVHERRIEVEGTLVLRGTTP